MMSQRWWPAVSQGTHWSSLGLLPATPSDAPLSRLVCAVDVLRESSGLPNGRSTFVCRFPQNSHSIGQRFVLCLAVLLCRPSLVWPVFVLQVLFSDEKRFCVASDMPVHVWRRNGQRYSADFIAPTLKCGGGASVMVWLCIDGMGNSLLLRCDDRQNASSYQNTILANALLFVRGRGSSRASPRPRLFQHDGAPSHTAHSTKAWLRAHNVRCLENWPPQSPDLNLVENCWAAIAAKMVGRQFTNANNLWEAMPRAEMPRTSTGSTIQWYGALPPQ